MWFREKALEIVDHVRRGQPLPEWVVVPTYYDRDALVSNLFQGKSAGLFLCLIPAGAVKTLTHEHQAWGEPAVIWCQLRQRHHAVASLDIIAHIFTDPHQAKKHEPENQWVSPGRWAYLTTPRKTDSDWAKRLVPLGGGLDGERRLQKVVILNRGGGKETTVDMSSQLEEGEEVRKLRMSEVREAAMVARIEKKNLTRPVDPIRNTRAQTWTPSPAKKRRHEPESEELSGGEVSDVEDNAETTREKEREMVEGDEVEGEKGGKSEIQSLLSVVCKKVARKEAECVRLRAERDELRQALAVSSADVDDLTRLLEERNNRPNPNVAQPDSELVARLARAEAEVQRQKSILDMLAQATASLHAGGDLASQEWAGAP